MQLIEDKEFLKYDILYDRAEELVKELSKQNNVYIVTARQSKEKAQCQIKNLLKCHKSIKDILVTKRKTSKYDLIKQNVFVTNKDYFIGDTDEDILAGKKLKIKTIGLYSGFFNKEFLSKFKPDLLLKDIQEIYENMQIFK